MPRTQAASKIMNEVFLATTSNYNIIILGSDFQPMLKRFLLFYHLSINHMRPTEKKIP